MACAHAMGLFKGTMKVYGDFATRTTSRRQSLPAQKNDTVAYAPGEFYLRCLFHM